MNYLEVARRAMDAARAEEKQRAEMESIVAENRRLSAACALLPAWFVPRMMQDDWLFALLLTNGYALVIATITAVSRAADGSIWLDVKLAEPSGKARLLPDKTPLKYLCAPTDRLTASINAAHVVAAFEVAAT